MTATSLIEVTRALEYCRNETRKHARNFYYGLRLAPEPHRSALFVMYEWMRRADSLADDVSHSNGDATQRIEAFRKQTDEILDGSSIPDDPLWVALSDLVKRVQIRQTLLHDMLQGQLDDILGLEYRTFEDLRKYCYRVASTVGLLCIDIWGYTSDAAPDHAIDRGIAFQLTNILRDYAEDFDRGRIYLPKVEFEQAHLTPVELRHWSIPSTCNQFILDQVTRAISYYERSAPLDEMITMSCRPTLWAMTNIYRKLLDKIARNPRNVMSSHRVRLSSLQKSTIAVRAGLRATMNKNGRS